MRDPKNKSEIDDFLRGLKTLTAPRRPTVDEIIVRTALDVFAGLAGDHQIGSMDEDGFRNKLAGDVEGLEQGTPSVEIKVPPSSVSPTTTRVG